MDVLGRIHQFESIAEGSVQVAGAVPGDWQSAALVGSVRPERRHDREAPRLERVQHVPDVLAPVFEGSQEMKDGPVMPDVVVHFWAFAPRRCLVTSRAFAERSRTVSDR